MSPEASEDSSGTSGHPLPTVETLAPETVVAREPAADYAANLTPTEEARAATLPSASVGAPVEAQKINAFFGIGAVVLLVTTVVVVVLLAIFVLNMLTVR